MDLFPEKQKDGNWSKKLVFNFSVDGEEVKELPLEDATTVKSIILV